LQDIQAIDVPGRTGPCMGPFLLWGYAWKWVGSEIKLQKSIK